MKVLIIEDERPASQKLIRLLKETDQEIEIMDILTSVEESTNWFLENKRPELIFMDIQLEDGISFEIFETVKIETPIIFTTAYDKYALKAFKVNSVDYLLKPIRQQELKNALDKFNNVHKSTTDYSVLESIIKQIQPHKKERFLIKIGERFKPIAISDIYCFYIMERFTFIITNAGKHYPIDYSLDKVEQLINVNFFFRISRNFIVNYEAIQDIVMYSSSRLKVIIKGWTEKNDILVSRERVSDFKKWMDR